MPRWNYRLAGVPSDTASLTVYAWDWVGNVASRTSPLLPLRDRDALEAPLGVPRPDGGPAVSPID